MYIESLPLKLCDRLRRKAGVSCGPEGIPKTGLPVPGVNFHDPEPHENSVKGTNNSEKHRHGSAGTVSRSRVFLRNPTYALPIGDGTEMIST